MRDLQWNDIDLDGRQMERYWITVSCPTDSLQEGLTDATVFQKVNE